ncbi:hypothetical protein [Caenibius tardaugens]|uniref:hypothetical protein n=1 Tax=Caenibius tardaugens TaxID=169176 RepID=UPI000F5F801E|nr:hypothetical protein [Caenibius tardaugens]AZI36976.1 hypothetical protein EGO55_14235 [Caenibius tardaugens NBRC 16725]
MTDIQRASDFAHRGAIKTALGERFQRDAQAFLFIDRVFIIERGRPRRRLALLSVIIPPFIRFQRDTTQLNRQVDI